MFSGFCFAAGGRYCRNLLGMREHHQGIPAPVLYPGERVGPEFIHRWWWDAPCLKKNNCLRSGFPSPWFLRSTVSEVIDAFVSIGWRQPRPTNLEACLAQLEDPLGDGTVSYSCQTLLINSQWYGLPQDRSRIFILCVKNSDETGAPSAAQVLADAQLHLQQMHLEMAPVVAGLGLQFSAASIFNYLTM